MSTTALHYLGEDALRRTYEGLAGRIRPGGVLVNGDHLEPDSPKVHELAVDIGRRRAERQQALTHEDWESVVVGRPGGPRADPLLAARDRRTHPRCEGNDLTLTDHLALLREGRVRARRNGLAVRQEPCGGRGPLNRRATPDRGRSPLEPAPRPGGKRGILRGV
ncbi:hypothetical protein ACFSNO_33850 [Streptomyces cirratus]